MRTKIAAPSIPWIKGAPLLFVLIWSGGFIALKIGLQYADPLTFLAVRYLCVVLVLLPLVLWKRPPRPKTRSQFMALVTTGLFLQAGYFSFTYLSLHFGLSAGAVALIVNQQPIVVGLLAPLIANEHVTAHRWTGIVMGVAGAVIVIAANASTDSTSVLGVGFGLLALLSITSSTLVEKRFGSPTHPVTANLIQCGVGLLVSAPLAWMFEPMRIEWTWPLVGSLAYLVFGATLIAITLLLALIRRGEASRVSALFFLVPPTTTLMAYVLLDERLALISLPGMLLAICGICLVMKQK